MPAVPTLPPLPPLPTLPPLPPSPSPLRRVPAREFEPPYDDELPPAPALPGTAGHVQGALALAFPLPSGVPATPEPPAPLRLVPPLPAEELESDAFFDPQPTPSAVLPPARPWAGRLVQALVEVLAGARPAAQLLRWTSAAVYADVERQVTRLGRAGAPGLRGVQAGVVRSVHVSHPRDGVAEVCALVQRGARARVVALRLEGIDGRWRCTALQQG